MHKLRKIIWICWLLLQGIKAEYMLSCVQSQDDTTVFVCGRGKQEVLLGNGNMYSPVLHPIYTALFYIYPDTMTPHRGIDIIGDPHIMASQNGEVVDACVTSCFGDFGKFVVIKHAENLFTMYAHMREVYTTIGAGVYRTSLEDGTIIGMMGATGKAFGTHLHFEVRNATSDAYIHRLDPLQYLEVYIQNCSNMFGVVDALKHPNGGYLRWYTVTEKGVILPIV